MKVNRIGEKSYTLVGCDNAECPASDISCFADRWNTRATDASQEALVEALRLSRLAIKSLPDDVLGRDPEIGHFYKDELLAQVDTALVNASVTNKEE